MIDTAVRVETPEHVEIGLPIAGPMRRAIAYFVDVVARTILLMLVSMIVFLSVVAFSSFSDMVTAHEGLMLIAYFVTEWFYSVLFEWLWDGRTPGKLAMGLRVVKENGAPIGLPEALLRNLLRAADLWPTLPIIPLPTYLVGGLVSATDTSFRRLGDLAAGTLVITEVRTVRPPPAVIEPTPRPEEMALIPAHFRLSADERRTLDSFVRRLRTMHPAHAEQICSVYATRLAQRLGVLAPMTGTRFLQLIYARLQETAVPARRRLA